MIANASVVSGLALLIVSLAIKVSLLGETQVRPEPAVADIEASLSAAGFEISRAAPNTDPSWVLGKMRDCDVSIANVSLQGWHRQAVAWRVGAGRPYYLFNNQIYQAQPLLYTNSAYYIWRLKGYLGIQFPPPKLRAVAIGQHCRPDQEERLNLKSLS